MADSTQRYYPDEQPGREISLGTILFGLILLATGALWLLDISGLLDITWTTVGAVLLILVGVALIVGAREGSHGGLVFLGIVLSVIVVVGSIASWPAFGSDVGDRTITPASIEELEETYEWGAGNVTLELEGIDFPEGETEIRIQHGAGNVDVRLPADVAHRVEWQVGAGDVDVLDRNQSGVGLDGTSASDQYEQQDVRVSLDIQVGVGTIEVTQ